MSDVTGPISTLPGTRHTVPAGKMCDTHPDRPATVRVQGETDSMGCEMLDLCEECAEELRASEIGEPEPAHCQLCNMVASLSTWRDPEEGSCGPVYRICVACKDERGAWYADIDLEPDDDAGDWALDDVPDCDFND